VQQFYGRLPKLLQRFIQSSDCWTLSVFGLLIDYNNPPPSFLLLQAAEKLKITGPELCKLQVADGIIPVIIFFLRFSFIKL